MGLFTNSNPSQKIRFYSVFDRKAKEHANPFPAPNDAQACRMIVQVADNPQSLFARFASDYELRFVGEFDINSGNFYTSTPELVAAVASLVAAAAAEKTEQ